MSVLQISSFRVENFKSIRDSENVDINDFNILIGKNDAGKSSMLEALECFLEKRKPTLNQFHKQDANQIVFSATFCGVDSDFRNALGEDYIIEQNIVEIKREFENRGSTTPSATTYLNGKELSSGAIVEDGDRLTKAQSRNFIWEHFLPDPIWISAERDVSEQVKLKGGTVLNQLLDPILKEGGINEEQSFQSSIDELERSLKDTADSVGADLTERMQAHMPDVANVDVSTGSLDISKGISPRIHIRDEYLDESVDVTERGSGVGSLLILSLMQTYVDMQVGNGYCLLFEEPENFLHPAAERKMFSALNKISDEGQVCISTHSQVMIDREKNAEMYVVRREAGESNFEGINEDTFNIIDEIGARNSDLLQSDFVIYVEGPSDVAILNEVGRHAIGDWESCNLVIQHLGGTGSLIHCEPTKLEQINRNFALLLDSDQTSENGRPKDEIRRIKDTFDEHDARCKVLEYREIENYYSPNSINEICHISIDADFVGNYDDIECKINQEMDDGYKFDKIQKGRKIVKHMYENGECIDPIDSFLRECFDKAKTE